MPVANMNCAIDPPSRKNVEAAAIDDQGRACNESRLRRSQEAYGGRNIFRFADSALYFLDTALYVRIVPEHRGIDSAGRDTIDANLLVCDFLAEAACKCLHRAFRACVGHDVL